MRLSAWFLFSISIAISRQATGEEYKIVERAQVPVAHPSFLVLTPGSSSSAPPVLLISSFAAAGFDHIYRLRDTQLPFLAGTGSVDELTASIPWPNEVRALAAGELGMEGYLVSSGFLVPGRWTGAVSFLDMNGYVTELTEPKFQYFYHRAILADVTGTGRMDLLTARARVAPFANDGELVWLKRPAHPLRDHWEEEVLAKGPDIHFRTFRDAKTNQLYVVAAQFLSKKIALYWIEKDGTTGGRLIDDTIGAGFDLDLFDLNNSGRQTLLVTNHEAEAAKAGVFAYEVPEDPKAGTWVKHKLLTGIETRQKGLNQASPGVAKAFWPDPKEKGKVKPWILVSGDGSQRLHLLKPNSERSNDWHYSESIILDAKSTIGEPVVADIQGRGLVDIIVPAYDAGTLYFLSVERAGP